MDYLAWSKRAEQFIDRFRRSNPGSKAGARIRPPATPEQVAQVEKAIARPLPPPFRGFLLTASGDCDFRYWLDLPDIEFGKKRIVGGLEYFVRWSRLARDYAYQRELVEEDVYSDNSFCQDPLPIGGMGNGNHIAIDLLSGVVIFLAHDEVSYILAEDFDSFLSSWEAICYLDFNISPYETFVSKDGSGIDPTDRPDLRRLRELASQGAGRDA